MSEVREVRVERDTMGTVEVPSDVYYGAQTMRAIRNFPIGSIVMPPAFVRALGMVKQAAAEANVELASIDERLGRAVAQAASEVAAGTLNEQFPISVYQTGSGTSSNMNANEVIAARANEILSIERGSQGEIHPNDHVNKGQSSNDIIPTVIHLSTMLELKNDLVPSLEELESALRKKACEFWPVIKTGRTHLQDATPIRLGQEFLGYADQIKLSLERVRDQIESLGRVALGGTAVGTGINCDLRFPPLVLQKIASATGLPLEETPYHFSAQSSIDAIVAASGILRTVAVSLTKIANDVRWMASGPKAGLAEILLPEVQPGSSIMPGKVNPVIAESVVMAAAQVVGYDVTITLAGQAGNFELNVMLPIVAYDLLDGISILAASSRNFARMAVAGMTATRQGPDMVEKGLMLVTALAPAVGYNTAAAIAKEAYKTGRTLRDLALEMTALTETDLDKLLDPTSMVERGNVS